MQGMAVGRAVDLTRFDGYEDLLRKLEDMFNIKTELCGSLKKCQQETPSLVFILESA